MIGKWSVVIEKNILKVCVVLAFCCMVLLQNNVYGATTENGSRSNPYLVQTESKLKNIFSNNKKTSVVYIAIVGNIKIKDGIKVTQGRYMLYSSGGERTISRSKDISDDVNKSDKYCFKISDGAEVHFGDGMGGYKLYLDGKKNQISFATKGFIKVDDSSTGTIGNACVVKNVTNYNGETEAGAVRSTGTLNVYGIIHDCDGVKGGGITIKGGVCNIWPGAQIYKCFTLSQGGGVYVGNYSELRIYDGEIFENEALEEGGGSYIGGSSHLLMTAGIIHNNKSGEEGGGIFGTGLGTIVNINDGWIYGNDAGASAGGVFSGYQAGLILGSGSTAPTISGNESRGSGGGVRCNGGVGYGHGGCTVIYNARIIGNKSGNLGGGVACGDDSKITIEAVNIFSNSSVHNAGGLSIGKNVEDINGGAIKLYNSIIGENGATDKGGGICTDSSVLIRNTSINNNSSQNGGGLYIGNTATVHMWMESYINNNYAYNNGGGVYIGEKAGFLLTDNNIYQNNCDKNGTGVYVRGKFQMFSIASVDESNEVYLTRNTYISIIDRLLKPSGYVAVIRTTLTDAGTIIAQVEYSTDAQNELYYAGDAVAESNNQNCVKKFLVRNISGNKLLRPTKFVKAYVDNEIIISEKYDVIFNKNTSEQVSGMPENQIKFWQEDIIISGVTIRRNGYHTVENKHWNFQSDGNGETIKPGGILYVNGNQILYAQWEKEKIINLFINATDRYYVVNQNIKLDMNELVKKVKVTDDTYSNKKYPIYIKNIIDVSGKNYYERGKNKECEDVNNSDIVLTEKFMNTESVAAFIVTVCSNAGDDSSYAEKKFGVYIINNNDYNPMVRFVSKEYMDTLNKNSKWNLTLKDKLEKSLNKKEGEGIKKYKMSKEMVNNIKKGRN